MICISDNDTSTWLNFVEKSLGGNGEVEFLCRYTKSTCNYKNVIKKGIDKMELVKVKTVSKKQAKAYAIIALDTLSVAPNDLDIKSLWEEIEVVMKLYTPRDATKKAETILAKGGNAIWQKKK